MNMNLLIVDDEYEILVWLEEMFLYECEEEIGVYTASSAFEALELLNQVKFDVVLTDIKMPGMDGIELFRHIKSNWPRCKTIFLTGYPNFEDMYQIIKHKDVRYMLKSEDDEVIMQTVRSVFAEIQEEMEQAVLKEKRQQDMEKIRRWMGRDLISRLLKGELAMTAENELFKQVREAEIPLDMDREMLLLLVRIDAGDPQKEVSANRFVLLEKANQIIRNNLPPNISHFICMIDNQWGVGLLQASETGKTDMNRVFAVVNGALEYSQRFFERYSACSFSAAVESTPLKYQDLTTMYARMKQMLSGGLGREKAVIVHVETLNHRENQGEPGKAMMKIPVLKTHLELHRRQEYFALLDDICADLRICTNIQDAYGLGVYYSVSMLLLQFINENEMSEEILSKISPYKLTSMAAHPSWGAAVQYLFDVSTEVFVQLDRQENDLSDRALKRICDYIAANLDKELSLTKLADIGGFNASYLSRLFKQKHDVTITEYISKKRMKLAGKLLSTTNERIQDIAEKCGYLSPHSFSRAFKGYYAMSPAEYREIRKKGQE